MSVSKANIAIESHPYMAFLLLIAIAAAPFTAQSDVASPVRYGCDDLVVIGRMKNVSFTPTPDKNDLLGHGKVEFDVLVDQRLRGLDTRRRVRVSTIAHVGMNEDHEFVLVLSPDVRGDGYHLEDVRVWQLAPGDYPPWIREQAGRPTLAPHCG
jgi:hypothetical protein